MIPEAIIPAVRKWALTAIVESRAAAARLSTDQVLLEVVDRLTDDLAGRLRQDAGPLQERALVEAMRQLLLVDAWASRSREVILNGCDMAEQHANISGVTCPANLVYPKPPSDVDTLFVGWNPPGPTSHFWTDPNDDLRRNLMWVLQQLEWTWEGSANDGFLEEFRRRRCYFVHAVKCWHRPKPWPGAPITRECAEAMLRGEIADLRPNVVIALGRVPHLAVSHVLSDVPRPRPQFRYGEGHCVTTGRIRVIITAFPNSRPNPTSDDPDRRNRDCTLAALRRWWDLRA